MSFVHFLMDTPVVAFMLLLVLLVTVGPIVAGLLSRNKSGRPDEGGSQVKAPPTTRFLGIQMDIAILIFGFLLLVAVIGWVKKTFFG